MRIKGRESNHRQNAHRIGANARLELSYTCSVSGNVRVTVFYARSAP